MKQFKTLIIVFGFSLLSFSFFPFPSPLAIAQTPSQLFNFQGVLVDNGGNVLYDLQESDIVFSIVDGSGEVLFSETQHVPIVNGAISVLVGNGERLSGDDLVDVFDMPGDKILRVKLDDHTIPQEDVQIVSVPYAMIAERLSSDITSAMITDGTIQQVDLSAELIAYIDSQLGLSEADLIAHRTEDGAHPARSITVENNFVNMPGTNLQQILSHVDTAIGIRTNQDGVEEAARIAADTAEATIRQNADTTLQNNINAEASARQSADTAEATARANADAAHAGTTIASAHPGNLPTTRLSGQIDRDQIADDAINSAKIQDGTVTTSDLAFNFNGWDTNASDDLTTSTTFGGDVSGGYNSALGYVDIQVNDAPGPLPSQLVFAWARVDVSTTSPLRSCPTTGLVSSYNITCATKLDTGRYGIRFDSSPSSTNYVVIGTAYGGADRAITIDSMTENGFVVDIWEIAAEFGNHIDSDFMVMVLGGN